MRKQILAGISLVFLLVSLGFLIVDQSEETLAQPREITENSSSSLPPIDSTTTTESSSNLITSPETSSTSTNSATVESNAVDRGGLPPELLVELDSMEEFTASPAFKHAFAIE